VEGRLWPNAWVSRWDTRSAPARRWLREQRAWARGMKLQKRELGGAKSSNLVQRAACSIVLKNISRVGTNGHIRFCAASMSGRPGSRGEFLIRIGGAFFR
jgi:hypothetical protein